MIKVNSLGKFADALLEGLRLSSQSAGIGGYGYDGLAMLVVPAE